MPLLANAKKALRVSKRKTIVNNKIRSQLKTILDSVRKTPTTSLMNNAFSVLDIAVKNHIIHKNKSARIKSQLSKLKVAVVDVATKVVNPKSEVKPKTAKPKTATLKKVPVTKKKPAKKLTKKA